MTFSLSTLVSLAAYMSQRMAHIQGTISSSFLMTSCSHCVLYFLEKHLTTFFFISCQLFDNLDYPSLCSMDSKELKNHFNLKQEKKKKCVFGVGID